MAVCASMHLMAHDVTLTATLLNYCVYCSHLCLRSLPLNFSHTFVIFQLHFSLIF